MMPSNSNHLSQVTDLRKAVSINNMMWKNQSSSPNLTNFCGATDPGVSPASTPGSIRKFFAAQHRSMSNLSEVLINLTTNKVGSKIGIYLAFFSGVLLTLYSLLYKTIQHQVSRTTVLALRGVFQFVALFIWAQCQGASVWYTPTPPTESEKLEKKKASSEVDAFWCKVSAYTKLVLVATFGGMRLTFLFVALQLTPMTTVHTILNGNPIVVMILSQCMIANDKCSMLRVISGVLLVCGIILNGNIDTMANDEEISQSTIVGIGAALTALIFSALGSVLTKQISKNFNKKYISSYIGLSILIFGIPSVHLDQWLNGAMVSFKNPDSTLFNVSVADSQNETSEIHLIQDYLNSSTYEQSPSAEHHLTSIGESPPLFPSDPNVWIFTVLVAVMGTFQQYCLIAALQHESPSRVTMVRSSQIVLSFSISAAIGLSQLGQSTNSQSLHIKLPTLVEWLGALLVMCAIALITYEVELIAVTKKRVDEFKNSIARRMKKSPKSNRNDIKNIDCGKDNLASDLGDVEKGGRWIFTSDNVKSHGVTLNTKSRLKLTSSNESQCTTDTDSN